MIIQLRPSTLTRCLLLCILLLTFHTLDAQTRLISDSVVYTNADHTQGIRYFADGSRFEGELYNSIPNGKGRCYYSNGDQYWGVFFMGRPLESVGRLVHHEDLPDVDTSQLMSYVYRPRVGIVLSGGAAECASQIGVLRRIEESGIPVDYVVGTGMGAVIGSLYAMGYSADAIERTMNGIEWPRLGESKSVDLTRIINSDTSNQLSIGSTFESLFNNIGRLYPSDTDFLSLPVSFACVATNAHTGRPQVLTHGQLDAAIRASVARPSISFPVVIDGELLIDGGLVDNLPALICYQLGADILIGIDANASTRITDSIDSWGQLLETLISTSIDGNHQENVEMCQVYLHPTPDTLSVASIDSLLIADFIQQGYLASESIVPQLQAVASIAQSFDWSGRDYTPITTSRSLISNNIKLHSITLNHMNENKSQWVSEQQQVDQHRPLKLGDIEKAIEAFMGTGYFSDVTYDLRIRNKTTNKNGEPEEQTYDLVMNFQSQKPFAYGFKYRADSEEGAAILFSSSYHAQQEKGFQSYLKARLSTNPRLYLQATYGNRSKIDVNASYHFRRGFYDMCDADSLYANTKSYTHNLRLYLSHHPNRHTELQAGLDQSFLNFNQLLVDQPPQYIPTQQWLHNRCLSPFASLSIDTIDREAFPTHGYRMDGTVQWHIDNSTNSRLTHFLDARGSLVAYFTTDKGRFTISPQVYGRWIEGNTYYFAYRNVAGGDLAARYMDYQMPFIGINTPQIIGDATVILRTDCRLNLTEKHYVTLMTNYLYATEGLTTFFSFANHDCVFQSHWGWGVQYGYNASFGPVTLDLHWSTLTHRFGIYVNMGFAF
ncbi:MAG: patatin-like phospholipase family protein [Bacteroidales bacterium]|nr:patatin-like phospholipase family protein [Bacteroidales bacterium]